MSPITLCLTIGRRPDLLKQTLDSLLCLHNFSNVIAINDFRDQATNDMFKTLCPEGQLISLDKQLGHHGAVDFMYHQVTTPYVLHCEDDWLFHDNLNLQRCLDLLNADSRMSQVCLRQVSDFQFPAETQQHVVQEQANAVNYFRLDGLHPQWHGYTFNLHLASIDLWRRLGGFSQFKKERHISRYLRKRNRFTAYIDTASCVHIGEHLSVSSSASNPTALHRLRRKLKSFFL